MEYHCQYTLDSSYHQEEIEVKRVKFRIPTWNEGRTFMKEIASELNANVEVQDANELIRTEKVEIRYFPDDRGFAFITCKIFDETIITTLEKYIEEYKNS